MDYYKWKANEVLVYDGKQTYTILHSQIIPIGKSATSLDFVLYESNVHSCFPEFRIDY